MATNREHMTREQLMVVVEQQDERIQQQDERIQQQDERIQHQDERIQRVAFRLMEERLAPLQAQRRAGLLERFKNFIDNPATARRLTFSFSCLPLLRALHMCLFFFVDLWAIICSLSAGAKAWLLCEVVLAIGAVAALVLKVRTALLSWLPLPFVPCVVTVAVVGLIAHLGWLAYKTRRDNTPKPAQE